MIDKAKIFTGVVLVIMGALLFVGKAVFGLSSIVGTKHAFLLALFPAC